jgi:hypothetical protein
VSCSRYVSQLTHRENFPLTLHRAAKRCPHGGPNPFSLQLNLKHYGELGDDLQPWIARVFLSGLFRLVSRHAQAREKNFAVL